ncbi:NAD(P)-binding protein [Eremomyces bilateralis CBS 781.70]|uniref:NAD(P)-binding protein n=1 Tax=Eremomyces bilateralis CBS 781.70 TaxID=1392243 RepID=A0A6G1G0T8_9PEZI|nr:NAD(P)-binding protein [Eremomyces bilateralis CBS 781.70]KAF1811653.1 NAD(P)-binding protein [Eremomyces bilateralis CBS 781.70]
MAPKVFLITGCSTGFGNEYVKTALQDGHKVVATARKPSTLTFDGANDSNLLGIPLDVTDSKSIDSAFAAAVKKFGSVDVVVNNAGYGLTGEFEALSDAQIRQQMEVNFFGLIAVTRKAMETMRDLKTGGVIQQITSIGGQIGMPLRSIYHASKWAVEGFTESVSQEVKPEWGIKFTCIEPGGFRTDWAGRSMEFAETKNPAYDHLHGHSVMSRQEGYQAGDPVKGVQAFYELAMMENPPLHCVVGTDAYALMKAKLERYAESVEKHKELSNSTDVDGYKSQGLPRLAWNV